MGGCTALADSAWRPLELPVEKPWLMLGWPFLTQTGVENVPFTLYRLYFWHFRQLLVRRNVSGQRALTIECSLMSGCGQGQRMCQ